MRRKINYQSTEYIEDGEVVCFGLSEHILEENLPSWTPKAEKDLNIIATWAPLYQMKHLSRPAYQSDFNYTNYTTRAQFRVLLGYLFIRELPVKNFYVRCWVMYLYATYFLLRGNGRGLTTRRPLVLYNHDFHQKVMLNFPDLYKWNLTRVLPRNPPTPDMDTEWRYRQTPVFHQVHKTVYRYRMRKPRYVPWDGTMSQPVMPFLHDQASGVINGTFRRNCNSTPQNK